MVQLQRLCGRMDRLTLRLAESTLVKRVRPWRRRFCWEVFFGAPPYPRREFVITAEVSVSNKLDVANHSLINKEAHVSGVFDATHVIN